MDTEFINVYIEKQKQHIENYVARTIILEAKLAVAESTSVKLGQKVEELENEIEKLKSAQKTKQPQ